MNNKMTPKEIADDVQQTLDGCSNTYRSVIEKRINELLAEDDGIQAPSAAEVEQQLKDFREMNDSFEPSATVDVDAIVEAHTESAMVAYHTLSFPRPSIQSIIRHAINSALSQKRYTREDMIALLQDVVKTNGEDAFIVNAEEYLTDYEQRKFDSEVNNG